MNGTFIISLDYELMWGSIFDPPVLEGYRKRVPFVRQHIHFLLDTFVMHGIHATWAIVGAIGCKDKAEAEQLAPEDITDPQTGDSLRDYIRRIDNEGVYFMPDMVRKIAQTPGQEIGCHTFSHFCVKEHNNAILIFREDLKAAKSVLSRYTDHLSVIAFPKNQVMGPFCRISGEEGMDVYRGSALGSQKELRGRIGKLVNFIDSYLPILGYHDYRMTDLTDGQLYNVRASRFFRTYERRLAVFEWMKLRRILCEMDHAARSGLIYHLWFHPHNLSTNIDRNYQTFGIIVNHFVKLNAQYGFQSLNISECVGERIGASRDIGVPLPGARA